MSDFDKEVSCKLFFVWLCVHFTESQTATDWFIKYGRGLQLSKVNLR